MPFWCARPASSPATSATKFVEAGRLGPDVEATGLDLGEVEHVFDEREERRAGGLHPAGVGLLRRGEVGLDQQAVQAEDAVERRPELVADDGQEARLGEACGLRPLARVVQAPVAILALVELPGPVGGFLERP